MRKILFDPIGTTLPPSLPPSPSPSPSQSYYNNASPPSENYDSFYNYFLPTGLPVAGDSASEKATISIIFILLILSLFSLLFIFHLRIRSQWSHHLQKFSSAWTIRILLVILVSFWAFNEILRLPYFRKRLIYPHLRTLSLPEEANLCKIYVVLSLGLYQPAILATLLFLLRISVKKRCPSQLSAITKVGSMCLPVLLGQIFVVFYSPLQAQLPGIFYRGSVVSKDWHGHKNVYCTYPWSSTIVFACFGMSYTLGFSLSCWKVLSVAINRSITYRINYLAMTINATIPLQVVLLALSALMSPGNVAFEAIIIAMFFCAAICVIVGLGTLVVKPTADALASVVDYHRSNGKVHSRMMEVDQKQEENGQKQ
ncbi:hypothetical protein POM88_047571 [Heracleum sosnowskyi]|uniref:Uncharacterized protein n=1 Tax=Heracleum sosnowskyi TaxID=360622 RepID=A0AAD8LXP9_9APIA|nr:hypothetical protein POM88_047571 [Heracleum sosnowskyi]